MNFKLWLENTKVKFPTLLIDKVKIVYDIITKAPDYESARQQLADLGKEIGINSFFNNSESIYKLLSKTNKPFTQQEKIEYIPKFMNVIRLCMQKFKNLTNDGFYYFAPHNVGDTTPTSSKYHIQISPQDIEVKIPELIEFMSKNQNLFYQFKFAKTHHTNFQFFDQAEWDRSDKLVIYITKYEIENRILKKYLEDNKITFESGSDVNFDKNTKTDSSQQHKYSNTEIWALALLEYLRSKKGYQAQPHIIDLWNRKNHPELKNLVQQRLQQIAAYTGKPSEKKIATNPEAEYYLGKINVQIVDTRLILDGTKAKVEIDLNPDQLDQMMPMKSENASIMGDAPPHINWSTKTKPVGKIRQYHDFGNVLTILRNNQLLFNNITIGDQKYAFLKIELTPQQLEELKGNLGLK